MKTVNIKTKNSVLKAKLLLSSDDKAPCYFTKVEKSEKRKDWKWSVGVKYLDNNEEFSFKMLKIGDTSDEKLWKRITSVDFAIELIDLFRDGGELAVKTWLKNGCP